MMNLDFKKYKIGIIILLALAGWAVVVTVFFGIKAILG